jgi:hypothetical protein
MATESQTDFSGGLNTRTPAHLLASNQLTELQNVDLSHNDLRGEYGTKSGGETDFYYEAASAWVSGEGFQLAETILDWPYKYDQDNITTISSVTSGTASKIKFTFSANHGLSDGDVIKVTATTSLPGNIVADTKYYVNDKDDTTFYVEPSIGGGNITYSSTGSGTRKIVHVVAATVNYFSGSPNAEIGDGTTIEIDSSAILRLFTTTQGIHGANSYVEYNDDLYIARSSFEITATSTDASDILTTGDHTNKFQVGDELVNALYLNAGTFIKSINTANSSVTLNQPAIATHVGATYTVNSIISKYVDGITTESYRAGVNTPIPVIEFDKKADSSSAGVNYNTGRNGSHSDAWYGITDPIPFQYGLAEYDATGVESTMSKLTDSNIGTIGGDKFPNGTADVNNPQYINISGVDRYSTTNTSKGRFALYRVGGTSAFIKRCDNLFLDNDLTVNTAQTTSTSKLTVTLGSAKDAFQYRVRWYAFNFDESGGSTISAKYNYYNSSTGYINPFVKTGEVSAIARVPDSSGGKLRFSTTAHNLINGNEIRFATTGVLPAGISLSTSYFVSNKTANEFFVEESAIGNGEVVYSSDGSGTLTWTGYPTTQAYFGETEYKNPSSGNLAFVLDSNNDTHFTDIFVEMKIPGETVEREYMCRTITHGGGDAVSGTGIDYIDFNRADSLVDIQPIQEASTPAKNMVGLIESSNLFFAFKDNRLHVSDYGNPNSWPESGFLDFDQNITGLGTLGSELVVFTEYGMYRVFGTDPSLLKKVQIPTTEGIKDGSRNTITKFQSGIFFAGLNGICFYDGQGVRRITQESLDAFALPNTTASNNHGGYHEDTYYLLGTSGIGYKIDVKGQAILSRTTQTASNLFFRGSDNTLYGDTGTISNPTGTRSNFTATTRKFAGADINMEKIFYSITLTGESFSGTINFLVDGTQTDTFSVGSAVTDLDRTFYLAAPRAGNGAQVQLSSCTGVVNKISVNYDGSETLAEALYTSVKLKYVGTPTVSVSLDSVANISATTLDAPTGAVGEATLYFGAMSTGLVPHLIETNNEASGRVLEFAYAATGV